MSQKHRNRTKEKTLEQLPEPDTPTYEHNGDRRHHHDYEGIKRRFGIGSVNWDKKWTKEEAKRYNFAKEGGYVFKQSLLPNIINHTWDPTDAGMKGGTDWLAVGIPGSGKSNLALWLSLRLMEHNMEKVVWRASTSRSEWLPFAPWARVCLPAGVDITARFEPQDPTGESFEVELEDVVREVVRYRNPRHLNQELLKPGMFHVVYPDPKMRGLQETYEADDEKQYEELEFTPDDPLSHWWFGYVHSRIKDGPHHWTSIIFDEIGDIAPESVRNDEYSHYQKVELLKDNWVDARKKGLSIFSFGHSESDIHSMIRRKIRWRVTMGGKANPTSKSEVAGFSSVPMNQDLMSNRDVGEFTIFSESTFQYPPADTPYIEEPVDASLSIELN